MLKSRINLSVSNEKMKILKKIAKRDQMPVATKVTALLDMALQIEEDVIWDKLASLRDTKDAIYLTHEQAWK